MTEKYKGNESTSGHPYEYVIENFSISSLTHSFILKHSSAEIASNISGFVDIQPQTIEINYASFVNATRSLAFPMVVVQQRDNQLVLACECQTPKTNLCEHQIQVLYTLLNRHEIRIFFDEALRYKEIKQVAIDYGLENEQNPDDFFQLEYANKKVEIKAKLKELIPVTKEKNAYWAAQLLPRSSSQLPLTTTQKGRTKQVLVFKQHKYYDHFNIELFEAQTTQGGKIKNPLQSLNPLDLIWKSERPEELKFYSAISKFQNNYESNKSDSDIEGLKALVKNPLNLAVFYHNAQISTNVTVSSVVPVELKVLPVDIRLSVHTKENFYEVSGQMLLNDKLYELKKLKIKYNYFILLENTMYLIDNLDFLRVIEFFNQNHHTLLIHRSRFEEFQSTILANLEHQIRITYSYLKPATREQLQQNNFLQAPEQIIYLSDSENYVLITPVMKYGNVEIPVLSKKQIYSIDHQGNPFTLERDEKRELQFTADILKQHPDFKDQLNRDYFYLHKERFLDEDWFLEAFEEWNRKNITVLGFSKLKNNKLNAHKAKISIRVNSGQDWFDTTVDIRFGKQKASLKHLHKAVRNKSKYVQLGDGTMGILPKEWMDKIAKYFQYGDIIEESLRTPKVNFSGITELYKSEELGQDVKEQITFFKSKLSAFQFIQAVEVSEELRTELREYQKQGLNWLNFLDEFNFGGCLADDMGLGKTVQIIAFILSQRRKGHANTNLVIVPTSLLFNWQAEVEKFAPSIKIYTVYGTDRVKDCKQFDHYEIILTSYGTLLSDVRFLKEYRFNYIFLDEAQAIKNPDSQRYKAVCQLKSRNKIVLTGTPIENNTFDLFGLFSFACPGLLGSKQLFRDHYAIPIDRFKDGKRAKELQKKVNPFLLRRTKTQVAQELPDKTEMVIYCEMGSEQRKVYDAYAKEFRNFLLAQPEEDLPRESMHVLQGLTKLRQICDSPALLKDEVFYGESSAKIDALIEQIETKSSQHKILVFSQFVSMLELIKKELEAREIAFAYLTGQTRNRGAKVDEFQHNADVRIFLISLKAGGTGLNLTEADYVYLVDPWWNPAVENQAIDRCYRIGQKKNVVAVRLICPNTVEEKIMHLQKSKKELVNDLVKTDVSIVKSLSKKELIGLFS